MQADVLDGWMDGWMKKNVSMYFFAEMVELSGISFIHSSVHLLVIKRLQSESLETGTRTRRIKGTISLRHSFPVRMCS